MPRKEQNKLIHREVLERYCPVIDSNTIFVRRSDSHETVTECVNHEKCKGNGGCQNAVLGKGTIK